MPVKRKLIVASHGTFAQGALDAAYECRKCGLTIERYKSTPQNITTCENKHFHTWHKL
jgi:mannose/fructose-specific phosphotransferase system component IIA